MLSRLELVAADTPVFFIFFAALRQFSRFSLIFALFTRCRFLFSLDAPAAMLLSSDAAFRHVLLPPAFRH